MHTILKSIGLIPLRFTLNIARSTRPFGGFGAGRENMFRRGTLGLAVAALALISVASSAHADVRLPTLFSEHMVLQRGAAVPVWGWAEPGEAVAVSIAGQTKAATANADGKWRVTLEKLDAAGPFTLTVKGRNTVQVEDVLVGEVWLASGQSNMQLPVNGAAKPWAEKPAAQFPQIRMFTVDRRAAIEPQAECQGRWIVCSPETVGNFSAAAYFFGRELHQHLRSPVGLINASWGGTPIETWTSMSAQADRPELEPVFAVWREKTSVPFDEAAAREQYNRQLAAWKEQSEKARAAGKQPPRAPVPPVAPRLDKNHPANLFNGMIAPLIPYAIRGTIWYQGENNANNQFASLYARQLPLLIQDWRTRWGQGDFPFAWVQLPNFRQHTEDPEAPSNWAVVREAMRQTLAVPHTGMAITIDVGEANDIHPKDKQTVGKRLALWALAQVYGENMPYSGPLPAGHKIRGSEVVLSFTHAEGGLAAKGGELKGFALAGGDKKWVWAKAHIEGNQVIVSHPEVKAPASVRYAWADNPEANLYNGAGLPASPFATDL